MLDSLRIYLLQFATLLVEHAPHHIHDNNKNRNSKLRRLMTFAWPCLLSKACVDPACKYSGHLLLAHIIAKFAIHKKIVLQVPAGPRPPRHAQPPPGSSSSPVHLQMLLLPSSWDSDSSPMIRSRPSSHSCSICSFLSALLLKQYGVCFDHLLLLCLPLKVCLSRAPAHALAADRQRVLGDPRLLTLSGWTISSTFPVLLSGFGP